MLACDGQEAEFATAPVSSMGDGGLRLAREVIRCRRHMLKLLERIGVPEVRGFSTHLNISVPNGREWELAAALARTAGPALILLMEARQSPGLLIRPRRGRIEISSEYIDNEGQLAAACVFLTGVVHAYLYNESLWRQFPRLHLKHWEEANIRPGIYLPHDAYGESIYAHGWAAKLELEDGGTIRAGDVLEACSRLALRALEGRISPRTAASLRLVVDRSGSLQVERRIDPGFIASTARSYQAASAAKTLKTLALSRSRLGLTPRFVDWEGAAFSWETKSGSLVLGVPWRQLPNFFNTVQKNNLPRYVGELGPAEPNLTSLDQLQSPRVFQAVDPVALGTQALSDKSSGKGKDGGPSKPSKQFEPAHFPQTRSFSTRTSGAGRKWLTGIFIGLIVIITTVLIIRNRGIRIIHPVPPTPTITVTLAPTVTATPTLTDSPTPTDTFTPTSTRTPTRTRRPYVPPTNTRRPPPPPPPQPNPTSCDPATGTCGSPPTSRPNPTSCDPATGTCG
jgi:hypothetical protein